MKEEEDPFEILTDLDERFIVEAGTWKGRKRALRGIKWVAAAACLILAASVGAYLIFQAQEDDRNSYKAIAAETGKEAIQLGATMPTILYCDEKKAIMYDYIGIWVYDFDRERLAGFCDFRPIEMTRIQGYPYVIVEASADGEYVRFYMSDESKKYLYNVKEDSYCEVADYDGTFDQISNMRDISKERSLSNDSQTYAIADGVYVSYILDLEKENKNEPVTYGDLVILKEENEKVSEYRPFS